jgi:hypothetical protein
MVLHDRQLKGSGGRTACEPNCPHAEARTLWQEATDILGTDARQLTFLRASACGVTYEALNDSVTVRINGSGRPFIVNGS